VALTIRKAECIDSVVWQRRKTFGRAFRSFGEEFCRGVIGEERFEWRRLWNIGAARSKRTQKCEEFRRIAGGKSIVGMATISVLALPSK